MTSKLLGQISALKLFEHLVQLDNINLPDRRHQILNSIGHTLATICQGLPSGRVTWVDGQRLGRVDHGARTLDDEVTRVQDGSLGLATLVGDPGWNRGVFGRVGELAKFFHGFQ